MATPVLNNGIFLRDTNYDPIGSHFDRAHMMHLNSEFKSPTDLGVIDIWAMTQKKEYPLYTMSSFGGQNTIYTDSNVYKWKVPVQSVNPYIVEDMIPEDIEKPGLDGAPFQIKINNNHFGHGSVLTYDKYNGLEFLVLEDDIIPSADGYIYTVRLMGRKEGDFVDRRYLKANTLIFRVTSVRDEHSKNWDDFIMDGGGYREFYNYVGTGRAHSHYTISDEAALMGMRNDIVEMIKIDPKADPNVQNLKSTADLNNYLRSKGKKYAKTLFDNGDLDYTWTRKLDMVHMKKVMQDVENYLMWGKGGWVRNDMGPNDTYLSVGLWKQLDNGYKIVFTRDSFNFDMFENEIFNFFHGKVDFDGPESGRKLIVQTGKAGMKLIHNAIMQEVEKSNFILNATDVGTLTGDRMDLEWGISYTKLKIPFLANLEFVYNPAFDNVNQNDIENPRIEGYNLSSYSFIIYDFNYEQGSDNINLVKYAPGGDKAASDIRMFYQNGTFDYYGKRSGFASTGDFSGYKAKFEMRHPAIFVKDPTKVLKFVMKNPVTGGSL